MYDSKSSESSKKSRNENSIYDSTWLRKLQEMVEKKNSALEAVEGISKLIKGAILIHRFIDSCSI